MIWVWMGADRTLFAGVQVPALFVPPATDESGRALAWYVHVYGAWRCWPWPACMWRPRCRATAGDGFITRRMGLARLPGRPVNVGSARRHDAGAAPQVEE